MKVIIRRPAEIPEEYDLPDLDNTATDAQILAAAADSHPVHRGDPEIVGDPYVYARGLDDLAQQGRRMEQAKTRLAAEKTTARHLAHTYIARGHSKHAVAAALGVTRPTLDAWLDRP